MVLCILHVFHDSFDKSKDHDGVTCMYRTKVSSYAGEEGSNCNQYTTEDDKFGYIQFDTDRRKGEDKNYIYIEATVIKCEPEYVTLGVGFDLLGIRYGGKTGMVGWFNNSIGYHGDDGNIIDGDVNEFAKNVPDIKAPPYGAGDIIGAAWNTETGEIFFTLNGRKVDQIVPGCKNSWIREYQIKSSSDGTSHPAFVPTVSVDDGQQCTFSVNTGDRPFVVDIHYQQYVKEATQALSAARLILHNANSQSDIAKLKRNLVMEILHQYSPSLSMKELHDIMSVAEDRKTLSNKNLEKESFLHQIKPDASIFK